MQCSLSREFVKTICIFKDFLLLFLYIFSEYILQCVGLSAQEDAGHFMYCFSIFGTICIFKRASCASCSGVRAALGSVSFASLSWPGREGGDQPSSLWVPLFETFCVSLKLDSLRMVDLVFCKNLVDAARQLRIFSTDGNSMISYICSIDLLCLTGTLMMMVKRWY